MHLFLHVCAQNVMILAANSFTGYRYETEIASMLTLWNSKQKGRVIVREAEQVWIGFPAYSSTLKTEETCSSKRRLTFNGLLGSVSEKTELLITTAVITSNPIWHTVQHIFIVLNCFVVVVLKGRPIQTGTSNTTSLFRSPWVTRIWRMSDELCDRYNLQANRRAIGKVFISSLRHQQLARGQDAKSFLRSRLEQLHF
jgi:hypothetical protein